MCSLSVVLDRVEVRGRVRVRVKARGKLPVWKESLPLLLCLHLLLVSVERSLTVTNKTFVRLDFFSAAELCWLPQQNTVIWRY